jgi:hypothetical protein
MTLPVGNLGTRFGEGKMAFETTRLKAFSASRSDLVLRAQMSLFSVGECRGTSTHGVSVGFDLDGGQGVGAIFHRDLFWLPANACRMVTSPVLRSLV